MNSTIFSNILGHPKTSIAGLLIAVVTIAGVLSQQGISLGTAGTGTVVALVGAIAAALLGLISKDPGKGSGGGAATGAMIAFLCVMVFLAPIGCTTQQKVSVAQEIVHMGPQVQSTVDVVLAVLPTLDPPLALAIGPITAGWDLLAKGVIAAANDYLANPNQTNLQFLQAEIVKFQQSVNTAVLTAAGIKNSGSQALALAVLGAVAIAANAVLGLVQSISTKSQLVAMSKDVHITMAQVRPYLDQAKVQLTASRIQRDLNLHDSISPDRFFAYEAQVGF